MFVVNIATKLNYMEASIFRKITITILIVFSCIFISKAALTNDTIQIYCPHDELISVFSEDDETDLLAEIMADMLIAEDEIPTAIGSMMSMFVFPVKSKVYSAFGRRGSRMHSGVDLSLRNGDPIATVYNGVVTKASPYYAYGNLVIIDHGLGIETYYAHLSKMHVKVGDTVSTGQIIGLGGRTGRATGNHLHFEMREDGKAYNPELVFDFNNFEIKPEVYNKTLLAELVKKPRVTQKKQVVDMANVPEEYVIQPGDSLWLISRKFQVTIAELCALNNLNTKSVLRVGAVLKVY